jgi:hypothetical protein
MQQERGAPWVPWLNGVTLPPYYLDNAMVYPQLNTMVYPQLKGSPGPLFRGRSGPQIALFGPYYSPIYTLYIGVYTTIWVISGSPSPGCLLEPPPQVPQAIYELVYSTPYCLLHIRVRI